MPSTQQSIDINAPIESVWSRVGNFHDFSWAPSVITAVDKVGDTAADQVGARRILNGMFHETLVAYEAERYSLKYSIDDGPSPVSPQEVANYIGAIKLTAAGDNNTHVEWTSSWESTQQDAVEFCHGIYVALLQALKTSCEHQAK